MAAASALAIEVYGQSWILRARQGRSSAEVTGDADTLAAILDGRRPGLKAFLDGHIHVRGSLALAVQLETAFGNGHRHRRSPRADRIRAAGVDTFYLEAGTGTPILLLHGLGGTNVSFLPTLWNLSIDHRVFAPDLPGHGDSGKPIRRYDAAFYGDWLVALLNTLGLDRVHLVGNSLGARVALEVAMKAPERVDRLVLLAAAPIVHRLRRLVPLVRLLRPELAAIPIPMLRAEALFALRSLFAKPSRMPDEWLEAAADEFVRVFRTPGARVAFFSSLREIYLEEPHGDLGYWNRLQSVSAPALFVWGDHDPLVPPAHGRAIAEALPHSRSVVLKDCGHVPQYELPEATNRLIRDFLDPKPLH